MITNNENTITLDTAFNKRTTHTANIYFANSPSLHSNIDGFDGLVVSILATGTRVRGFKPGRSLWIFRASGKSSVCLPSEGK